MWYPELVDLAYLNKNQNRNDIIYITIRFVRFFVYVDHFYLLFMHCQFIGSHYFVIEAHTELRKIEEMLFLGLLSSILWRNLELLPRNTSHCLTRARIFNKNNLSVRVWIQNKGFLKLVWLLASKHSFSKYFVSLFVCPSESLKLLNSFWQNLSDSELFREQFRLLLFSEKFTVNENWKTV